MFGKTGSQIIEDIARGKTDPKKLVKHIVGPIKNKTEDFMRAFTGRVTSHHCFMIQQSLNHIYELGKIIEKINQETDTITSKYTQEFELLQTVPGVSDTIAAAVIGEIGVDMSQFPSDQHISSWAGLSPGSYESAGKKKLPDLTRSEKFKGNARTSCLGCNANERNILGSQISSNGIPNE